jgi:hypothetical protein
MTFAFNAMGTKSEVADQVQAANVYGNQIGETAKQLIIEALTADDSMAGSSDYEYRYSVAANGHSGGSIPTTLSLTLSAVYVPVIKM